MVQFFKLHMIKDALPLLMRALGRMQTNTPAHAWLPGCSVP